MDWEGLRKRIRPGRAAGTARFTLPPVVFEIEPGFVVGARLEGSGRSSRRVRRLCVRHLAAASLEPHPSRPNIVNAEELRRVLGEVAEVVGNGAGRFGLIVPDGAVRVAVLSFETLPENAQEAEALVRWRMRDRLPFAPEEARVSFQWLAREPGHLEVLAVAARGSVLAEYEAALEPLNGGPVLILPATAALLPLLPQDAGGHLLLHVCSGWITTVVASGPQVGFWRTRELDQTTPEDPAQEVASEAARILASARDHLKTEVTRAWLCVRPPATPETVARVSDALSREVRSLAPRVDLGTALSSEEQQLLEHFGAAIAGLVANTG